ncbi:syntenin-1 [Labeo rohita]|uniref:Syntenin-1 n=1 Tax=Labeo rohita TaxID=84645 RepID=A0A498LCY3_LABRO|nr:syntenin-1 [Labeo rohita]RXN31624.1 syntenin-1 [Labeo rohita]
MIRVASEDFTLTLDSGQTAALRKGDYIALYPQLIHLDPEIYPNPTEFKYDRFLDDDGQRKSNFFKNERRLKHFLLPFGSGASECPGRFFAVHEIKQFLALTLWHYDLQLSDPDATLVPDSTRAGLGILPPSRDVLLRKLIQCAPNSIITMSLYPSLEDMKVDKFMQAHNTPTVSPLKALPLPEPSRCQNEPYYDSKSEEIATSNRLYPELNEFMGLNLSADAQLTLSSSVPDETSGGVFVQLVQANTPAALAGLRFGDQILQINGKSCAGWSSDNAHKELKNSNPEKITLAVRDRPLERTVTLHKDMNGQLGFLFKKGRITSIVKDSSAARNGLLTDHQICEINGQNIIGLKDSQVTDILNSSGGVVTVTVMPVVIFEHMMKRMSSSIVKSLMDHSIPEV